MGRKGVWLAVILFVGTAFCLGACQSGKSAKTQITDPNAVFAQGGAHVETGGTPAHGGGRRGRGQFQGQNPGPRVTSEVLFLSPAIAAGNRDELDLVEVAGLGAKDFLKDGV